VRFKPGEALTSQELARLPSGAFDWLVTIDPHLHRCGLDDALLRSGTLMVSIKGDEKEEG